MESSYGSFAAVYDELMDNVPYKEWAERMKEILAAEGITDGLLTELGCGTGNMTRLLSDMGYDMTGIDNSIEMLEEAMEKEMDSESDKRILYLNCSMTDFEMYGTQRAFISCCDSVNYLTEPDDMEKMFRLVNNYLDPDGIFLFDFNTEYYYKETLGRKTIAETRDDVAFIWENTYHDKEHINELNLTLFTKVEDYEESDEEISDEETEELFVRTEECHLQRGYTLEEVKDLLKKAGLTFVAAEDGYTGKPAGSDSNRILVIARESGDSQPDKVRTLG